MARNLRSAGFTPQNLRAELSSNGYPLELRTAGLTRALQVSLRLLSTVSFCDYEDDRT